MHKKSFLYFFIFCIIISLSGCGTSDADSTPTDVAASVSETFSESTADTTATESKNEMVASSEPTADPEVELTIPDLPDDFIECTKYIGQNISEVGLDLTHWDSKSFIQGVGKSSLYNNTGTVSIFLGWDNSTITNVTLSLDDNEYIQGDEYSNISNKLEELFGEAIPMSDGITNYEGKSDYTFRLLRNGAGIAWNTEKQEQFDKSKPKNNESNEKATTTEEPKRDPEIGMTAAEVKNSTWGAPSDINKTTTKYGVREQWVYRSSSKTKYIYLEDGIVTTIQE